MKQKLGSSLGGKTLAPGPGNYPINMGTKKTAPSFGFGSSTRETGMKSKMNVPGPGAYKLRSSVGDVPSYAMPGRDEASKYVWVLRSYQLRLNFAIK